MPIGFTGTYTTPYYTGSPSNSRVPAIMPVGLAGHAYVVDLEHYDRQTVDSLRTPYDTLAEPGDQSLNTVGIWRRWTTHWEHGAGQHFYDERGSDPFRFNASKGINPWGVSSLADTRRIRLHYHTDRKKTSSNTNLALLAIGSSYLYAVDGTEVHFTANPAPAPATWTAAGINYGSGSPQSVQSVTTDGNFIYAALGSNGIGKNTAGVNSSTHFSTQACTLVGYANGHLLAANANQLYEIDSAGAATTIGAAHFNASFTYVAITATPGGIFVAGNSTDRGEFFFVGFNASTGGLTVPIPAGSLPRGELLRAMTFYQGRLLLGTSRGFRVCDVVQDRGVAIGPVIEPPGDVRCIDVNGEYAFFGWTNIDSTSTGIGRAKLSVETGPQVPAYASDLMAGILGSAVQGNCLSVATFGGVQYFAISASGVWGVHSSSELVPVGYVDSGLIRWGTSERKILSSLSLKHDALPANATVSATLFGEFSDIDCGSSTTTGSTEPDGDLSVGNAAGEEVELRVTLRRSSSAVGQGPVLRRWTLRAQVVPVLTDAIVLPIILKERVQNKVGSGQFITYDTLDEFLFLKGLETSRNPVIYQEGQLSQLVVVDKVQVKPDKWLEPKHRWFEGLVLVRLLTVQPVGGL